jgi:DNA repair protein RecO (recombination protein O)
LALLFLAVEANIFGLLPSFSLFSATNDCAPGKPVVRNKFWFFGELRAAPPGGGSRRADSLTMPAQDTEAIILKTFPLGEADRLVSFLSRSSGRMRGVAAGARKLKNRYGSTLELLAHVQMEYIERETRDLVRIQQCDLLDSFHAAQSEYSLATGLALVSEIVEILLPEREPAEAMFRLVLLTAREIERRKDWRLPAGYFVFWAVKLAGWLPPLDRCGKCGAKFGSGDGYHASWSPGLLCRDCRHPGMRAISLPARELAPLFARIGLEKLSETDAPGGLVGELRDACLDWIEHHTERKLITRNLLETA